MNAYDCVTQIVFWLVKINELVWSVPLVFGLLGVGLFFSFKLRFIQIFQLKRAFKYVLASHKDDSILGDISSFASLCTALSATLGTGNIVGIAVAISVGGPGTIVWILVSSFFCLATKYCEGFLAIKYRRVGSDGSIAGGPMYYIEKALGSKIWAKLFALFGIGVALVGIGTLAQTNSISAVAESFGVPCGLTSIFIGIVVALVTFGGIHRIADVAGKVVPFMTILYLGAALVILVLQANLIIPAIKLIIKDAFTPASVIGGGLGSALMHSIKTGTSRGIFCHEAGLGSAAIAAAAAKTNSPEQQGLVCMVGAFLSIVVCTITGLVLVTTSIGDPHLSADTAATAYAFGKGLGMMSLGSAIVNISILFFAFTTIIGWNYYGEKCTQYLFNTKMIGVYRMLFLLFVLAGPFLDIKMAFIIADIVIGLMAIPNIISLLALRKEIKSEKRE